MLIPTAALVAALSLATQSAPRPTTVAALPASVAHALPQETLDALRSPVGAQALQIDLPGRGATTLLLSRTGEPGASLPVELAHREGKRVVASMVSIPAPDAWRGVVAGVPDARVFVGVGVDNLAAGFVQIGNETWWIASPPRAQPGPVMVSHERAFDGFDLSGLRCHADEIAQPGGDAGEESGDGAHLPLVEPCREVRIAAETDTEFLANLFAGNTTRAGQYVSLLMGAMTEIYTRDVNARLPLVYLRLWTGPDVWTQDGSIGNQLGELRTYWLANMGAVRRDQTHLLSGRNLGGGVAWLPGLCGSYNYAVSANLGGSFPYPLVDHDWANWDPMVVAHETGHNFGAPHTHDGYSPPPDGCGTGDCTLAYEGTIMSYCHTCSGGMSNVSLLFHPLSIGSMTNLLHSVGCAFDGTANPPNLVGDYASVLAGEQLVLDPLDNERAVNCVGIQLQSVSATSAAGGSVVILPPQGEVPAKVRYTPAPGFSGADSFTYTAIDAGGQTATAVVAVEVQPYQAAWVVASDPVGIRANWYAIPESSLLPDFSALSPYGSAILSSVNIDSTGGNFSSSGRADLIAATFEGWLRVPAGAGGLVQLFVESDDGSRVVVDGIPLVNNDGLHGMVERGGSIALRPGKHKLRVEFFENYGGAGLILRWQLPGGSKVVVPPSAFTWGGSGFRADLNADGAVDGADLGILLGDWGLTGTPGTLRSDCNGDGRVDGADLGLLLAGWGV
ncbi:MAG: M12 family metallo-peptidase [Phycisphaerales bacterium]